MVCFSSFASPRFDCLDSSDYFFCLFFYFRFIFIYIQTMNPTFRVASIGPESKRAGDESSKE